MNLLSTLGWSADVVLYPAKLLAPEEMVVFYGPESEPAVREAKIKVMESLPSTRFVEVDPFSLSDCIEKMRPFITDDSVVNITGGTKVMSFTLALLAAYREAGEVPVIYMSTRNGVMKLHRIPLRIGNMKVNFKKNTTIYLILKILLDADGGTGEVELTSNKIREIMLKKYGKKVEDSTFNSAKERLKKMNLIVESRHDKDARMLKYTVRTSAMFFVGGD